MSTQETISIAIVEDSAAYMDCLISLIARVSHMTCVGAFKTAESFQHNEVFDIEPDIVLLDLNLPGRSGFSLIPVIQERFSSTRIIVVTQENSYLKTLEGIRLGVSGYILKTSSLQNIKQVIQDVHQGGCIIDPQLCGYVLKALEQPQVEDNIMSPRENQVLSLLAAGYSRKEIADELQLSNTRVGRLVEQIYKKLRVCNVAAAIATAIRRGLI